MKKQKCFCFIIKHLEKKVRSKAVYIISNKKLLLFFLILWSIAYNSSAQIPIHGCVTNKFSKSFIFDAHVVVKSTGITYNTDQFGYFYIPGNEGSKIGIEKQENYWIAKYPRLHWYYNNSIEVELYTAGGKLIHASNNKSNNGSVPIDNYANGIYILKVKYNQSIETHKVFISGHSVFISEHFNNAASDKIYSDTLIVKKQGYYDEILPIELNEGNSYFNIDIGLIALQMSDMPYLTDLKDYYQFKALSSTPLKLHLGEVESVKAIIDKNTGEVYYINLKQYRIHYNFARDHMGYTLPHSVFNNQQYNNVRERYLFPITINYFKALNIFTFEFFSGDGATCPDVNYCFKRLVETSFFGDSLFFYATNDSWEACNAIPFITPNKLFEGQNYQALNAAETYGYLKKVDIKNLGSTDLCKRDILLVNALPFDIPVLAGIITTEFQTPLSHVNVLSHNRGTPNMALRNGFENEELKELENDLVYLKVTLDSFYIRQAKIDEATLFWEQNEPQNIRVLSPNYSVKGLVNLDYANKADISSIGGKAANFAEMLNAFSMNGYKAPVPENYFAIPFYYYREHLSNNGILNFIDSILQLPSFYEKTDIRKDLLKCIRDSIKNSPLNELLLNLVTQKCKTDERFNSYRFRSSTNAEDIEGFNGAGLYDSNTGHISGDEKPIEKAIKKTWASLWNFAAFDERSYFKIDHQSCAMGVLVHRSFPNEDANGVVLSMNPYNGNHGYIVNTQYAEYSIVDPEPGIINDQLVVYTFDIAKEFEYTIEYFTCSNVPELKQQHVMSDNELFELADYIGIIKRYFYNYPYQSSLSYKNYALDIEFKVDSKIKPRKIYVKQVRPY